MTKLGKVVGVGLLIFGAIFFGGVTSYAATINVTAGDVVALIQAINGANSAAGADTIVLGGGTYTLTTVDNNINGQNGLPSITSPITIQGNGAIIERGSTGCTSTPKFRIFHVGSGGNLTLNAVTVRNGCADGSSFAVMAGGGLSNDGTVTITNSTFSGNSSTWGGGLFNDNTATITNSTFFATDTTCPGFTQVTSAQLALDPLPLRDNGGPTFTQALLLGSVAIDAASGCPPPNTDQRGVSRPQPPGGNCDVGAYEVGGPGPGFPSLNEWGLLVLGLLLMSLLAWTVRRHPRLADRP